MNNKRIVDFIVAVLMGFPVFTFGDCATVAFREGEVPKNPVYRVLGCRPAKEVVDQFRLSDRNRYGNIEYSAGDVAIEVTAANEDAEKYLETGQSEHWHFTDGCSSFIDGQLIARNEVELEILCCDLAPVRDVQCGLGGTRIVKVVGI